MRRGGGVLFPSRTPHASATFDRSNEAPYLREWLEYHLLIGFDAFFILNDGSDDDTQCILDAYAEAGIVWRLPTDVEAESRGEGVDETPRAKPRRLGQDLVFDTCVDYLKSHPDRFEPSRTWMMTHDTDEFVFLAPEEGVASIHEAVTALSRSNPRARSMEVPRLLFGSSGHDYYEGGLVTERFTRRQRDGKAHAAKSISLVASMAQRGEDGMRCHNTHKHTVVDLPPKNETTRSAAGCSAIASDGRVVSTSDVFGSRTEHLYLTGKDVGEVAVLMHYMVKSRQEFYRRICDSGFSGKYYKCPTCSPETYFNDTAAYANDSADERMAPLVARTKERMTRTSVGASCSATPTLQSLDHYRRCFERIKPAVEATNRSKTRK